jgi:hypothetical protein
MFFKILNTSKVLNSPISSDFDTGTRGKAAANSLNFSISIFDSNCESPEKPMPFILFVSIHRNSACIAQYRTLQIMSRDFSGDKRIERFFITNHTNKTEQISMKSTKFD